MRKEGKVLSKYLIEIRYPGLYAILDKRGYFAETLSQALDTDVADIGNVRIDVRNIDRTKWAFVSALNCGYASINPDSKDFFQDHASKFFKTLFTLNGFDVKELGRLGVKSTYAAEFRGTYEELRELYVTNFIDIKKPAQEIFGTKAVDLGLALNVKTSKVNFNANSGPILKEQLALELFKELPSSMLPEVALYFEIDFFKDKILKPSAESIISDLREYSNSAWEKFSNLKKLVFGK